MSATMVTGGCSMDYAYAVDHKMAIPMLVDVRLAAWSLRASPAGRGDTR